jgi:uncharacterized membrane protein YbhN (UPF0104 family)
VLFAAVVVLLGQLVPGAGKRLADASPGWLVLAVAFELLACFGSAAKWWAVFARPPHEIGIKRSVQIALAEIGGFAVVPAGAGGPAARIWGLRSAGMGWRMIGVRSVANGVIFNLPYITAALVLGATVALGVGPGDAPLEVALGPVGVVVVGVLVAGGLTLAGRLRWLNVESGWRHTAGEVLRVAPDGLREVPGLLRRPAAVLGATFFWAGDCLVLWAAFQAVGESPPIAVVVLGYMLGQLGSAVPLPGGVGGVEPVMLAVLTASGVGVAAAAAAIVCYRAIALGVQASLGALAVASLAGGERRAREAG